MRDKELDIIKGLACILMIFAHAGTLGRTYDNAFTSSFWYLGFFAPILFFASIGVSLIYQLEKRTIEKIIIFNLLFFLISFADRGRESINYFNITSPNLIASLAMANLFAVFFKKANGFFILCILIIIDRVANTFSIPPTIFYGMPFALIPWAGITTLGKYLFEHKKSRILILIIGLLITIYYTSVKHQTIHDQFLTTLFLGLSLTIYSLITIFAAGIGKIPLVSNIVTYLGKNTLLFYWVHLFILFTINLRLFAPLIWLFILIVTIISMLILKKLNYYSLDKFSNRPLFWLLVIISVFIPPLLNFSKQTHFYFFSALTIIFALNYPKFLQLKILDRVKFLTR